MKAILMLEDGKSFNGEAFGNGGESCGELILNTAVVGYQEMLTDPANAGKILLLTYPLIGNYGCAPKFNESKAVWPAALLIKEKTRLTSNWQAKMSFDEFIQAHKLLTMFKVDTRTLTVHLRQKGAQLGIISTDCFGPKELLKKISSFRQQKKPSVLPRVSVSRVSALGKAKKGAKKVAILDLGITNSIIRQLELLGLALTLLPYDTAAGEVLRLKPDGLIVSGGPEEDPGLEAVKENLKGLFGKLPILGISTGMQVIAAALGAKLQKLKLGHRGVNYPITQAQSYKGEITVQNHGWAVDSDTLGKIKNLRITGYNLNDRSVEEFASKKLKILAMQYLPVSPGFDEVNPALKKFLKMLTK
ncbi:MAG: glutamine-hydrolyzing carbamoyl-phosphate synthase small subunit [Candidatus Omnitrophota bacterium]|nr:glutamine-hydrolyzing carbamoyl-phosphate synthase small subunit [Candidatus Omnitrophota bacterium]